MGQGFGNADGTVAGMAGPVYRPLAQHVRCADLGKAVACFLFGQRYRQQSPPVAGQPVPDKGQRMIAVRRLDRPVRATFAPLWIGEMDRGEKNRHSGKQ